MVTSHRGSSLSSQLIKLTRGDSLIDTSTDLLSNEDRVTMVTAKPIAKLLKPGSNLIEMNGFLPSVTLHHIHIFFVRRKKISLREILSNR